MMHPTSSGLGRSLLRSGLAASESNVAECSYRPHLLSHLASPSHAPVRRGTLHSATISDHFEQTRTQFLLSRRPYSSLVSQQAPPDSLNFSPAPQLSLETPARTVSASLASIQSGLEIPSNVLLDLLTTNDKSYYQLLRSRLPPDFHRLDAYLLLRNQDPTRLNKLSAMDIERLIKRVGKEGLAGVLSLLLFDIVGSPYPAARVKTGYFQVRPGSKVRYSLLKTLLLSSNRGELLQDDAMALYLFQMLIRDYKRNSDPTVFFHSPVPSNFSQGDARNLVKRVLRAGSNELLPVLQVLRTHLERRTSDFPSAREASQLIEFYLQPETFDVAAALDVVRTLKDTHGLSQDSIDQAIRDGKRYYDYLKSTSGKFTEEQQANLENLTLKVSLRLISMKCCLVQRPEGGAQYLAVFQNLMDSFSLHLLPDSAIFDSATSPGVIAFKTFRSIFLHLLGQPGAESVRQALLLMQKCDSRLLAMLSNRDVQDMCDAAAAYSMSSIAVQAYLLIIKAKTRIGMKGAKPSPHGHSLVRDGFLVNTDTFIVLLNQLNSAGDWLSTKAVVRGLRLLPLVPTSLAQMHLRFQGAQRPRFIGALAGARMKDEAFELYQLWSDAHYDPDLARALVSAPIGDTYHTNSRFEQHVESLEEEENLVASSASCLVKLVKALCRGSTPRLMEEQSSAVDQTVYSDTEEYVVKARFAIEVFKRSQDPIDWTHYNLTALASACFYVRDIKGAFTALARISFMRHLPDAVDISVMLGGLMAFDPDKAVELFISHSTSIDQVHIKRQPQRVSANKLPINDEDGVQPEQLEIPPGDGSIPRIARVSEASEASYAPMRPSAKLTSTLMSRAMGQGRFDLVNRLADFAKEAGIASKLGLIASSSLLYRANLAPMDVVQVVKRLLASGWSADPALLDIAARQILKTHSLNLRHANVADLETEIKNPDLKETEATEQEAPASETEEIQAEEADLKETKSTGMEAKITEVRETEVSKADAKQSKTEGIEIKATEKKEIEAKESAATQTEAIEMEGTKIEPEDTEANVASAQEFKKSRITGSRERLSSVQSAVYLMEVSMAAKSIVNLLTVSVALKKIRNAGFKSLPRHAASNPVTKPTSQRTEARVKWVACIDRIVYALRWTSFFDTGHDYRLGLPPWKATDKGDLVSADLADLYSLALSPKESRSMRDQSLALAPPESPAMPAAKRLDRADTSIPELQRQPNVLPSDLFCLILEAYVAWGDNQGAAEVAAWMRDEARADMGQTTREIDDFVRRTMAALNQQQRIQSHLATFAPLEQPGEILSMLSGQQATPRLKGWWSYRGQ